LKVSQGDLEQSQIVLSIELDPGELEEQLGVVYRRAVQRVNIPGFRKGKAPRSVVERFVGREAMVEEALEVLVPAMTARAIEQEDLDVVAKPRAKVAQQDPIIIEATVAIRPQLDLGDYLKIRVQPELPEVNEEQVDQLVDVLRRQMGTWEPVERPVEFGDMITMDVNGLAEERIIVEEESVDYVVSEESTNPLLGFGEKLKGMSIGEKKEFPLPFPEDYVDADLAGKECVFTVSVSEIKEQKLPDADDDFAVSLNMDVSTYVDLRNKLEQDMVRQVEGAAERNFENQVIQAVLENSNLELPDIMVDDEIHHLLADQEDALRRQRLGMEEYLNIVGKTPDEVHEEARPSAVERITRTLVLGKIAEEEGIEVTDSELDEEIKTMVETQADNGESIMRYLSTEEGKHTLESMVRNRKSLARLMQIAKGELGDQVTEDESESETTREKEN